MADIFNIAGRIHSTSQEEVVTTTNEILDATQDKKQSEVNAEVGEELALHTTQLEAITGDNFVTVSLYSSLPSEGAVNTIYRVSSWDGTQVDASKYSEYAWNGSAYVLLSVRSGTGDGVFDISAYNLDGGNPTEYADLSAAIAGTNVPSSVQTGGMMVRFINSSTHQYEQWRLMSATWSTTVSNWQGVDAEPTSGSYNLVESGGVWNELYNQGTSENLSGVDDSKKAINSSGVIYSISSANYHVVTFDISSLQGGKVYITANTNWGNCLWSLYANETFLQKGGVAENAGTKYYVEDEELVIPANATTLYVAYNVSWETANVCIRQHPTSKIGDLEGDVSSIKEKTDQLQTYDTYRNDAGQIQTGYYIGSRGSIGSAGETYTVTDYVEVEEGETIYITASSNWGNALWCFYRADKTVLSVGTIAANTSELTTTDKQSVVVPNGAKYIVVARNIGYEEALGIYRWVTLLKKQFSGKKWAVVGDSLTEMNFRATKRYYNYVSENTDIEVTIMGVGGTGYKRGYETHDAFYQRISNVPTDSDVITIFGSFNDGIYISDSLGTKTDTGTATLGGCINTTLDNLFTAYPLAVVGIVSPTPWETMYPGVTSAENYVQLLQDICELRGIPFLDLFHCSGLRPWEESYRELVYTHDGGDGVHPDETGHKLIAPRFETFLNELII